MSWCEKFGFHVDHCKSLLTNSKNCSTHFVTYKPQSLSFGCRGTVGYLTCSTSRVFLPTCDDLADHTSFRYLTILRSTVFRCFCRELSIINVILGSVLTITKIQWWLSHTGITRYFLEKMSMFFVYFSNACGLNCKDITSSLDRNSIYFLVFLEANGKATVYIYTPEAVLI